MRRDDTICRSSAAKSALAHLTVATVESTALLAESLQASSVSLHAVPAQQHKNGSGREGFAK